MAKEYRTELRFSTKQQKDDVKLLVNALGVAPSINQALLAGVELLLEKHSKEMNAYRQQQIDKKRQASARKEARA